jgi:hypothetical protein
LTSFRFCWIVDILENLLAFVFMRSVAKPLNSFDLGKTSAIEVVLLSSGSLAMEENVAFNLVHIRLPSTNAVMFQANLSAH